MLLKSLSHSAEKAVIGGVIIENEALGDALRQNLRPEDFSDKALGLLYSATISLANRNEGIDEITLQSEVQKMGGQVSISLIAELTECTPTAANISHYAAVIKEAAMARSISRISNEMSDGLCNPRVAAENATTRLVALLGAINTGAQDIGTLGQRFWQEQEQRWKGRRDFIPTGIAGLDEALGGGLYQRELTVIGARPSVGKTALGLDIARRVAMAGKSVLFFSLEMPAIDITGRLVALLAKVPLVELRQGKMVSPGEQERLVRATEYIAKLKMAVNESRSLTPLQLRASARAYASTKGLDLVVIDYLQKLTPTDPRHPREMQVAEFAEAAKTMAVECSIPVIALTQLNRGLDRVSTDPVLSDLRDSGRIEQEADVVMLLSRETESSVPERKLSVAKCRNGVAGAKYRMNFAGAFGEFSVLGRCD